MTNINVYICHSWVKSEYAEFYRNLLEKCEPEDLKVCLVSHYSHNIQPPYGTPDGLRALFNAFRLQISEADLVILPSYMIAWRRYWAKPQLDMAQYEFDLPIWTIKHFTETSCEALSRSNKVLEADIDLISSELVKLRDENYEREKSNV